MKRLVPAAIGAALMYLFDPELGRTRRAKLSDQLGGLMRRVGRETERRTEYARGHAEGLRHMASSDSPPASDAALTAKVESEVLSRWHYPKGSINVNSVGGVVELRGVCESPEQISDLEADVRKVTGVIDVHNFLHLPGTPAPNLQ
ncbi:MAG: BON domain-containing protein [Actinomycetota bacterium]